MGEKLPYILPEIFLCLGILHQVLLYILKEDSAKIFARAARSWLIGAIFFSVVFYYGSFSDVYVQNNAYTLLFDILVSLFAYVMLGPSSLWFATYKRTGCRYNMLILASLLCFREMLSSVNVLVLFAGYLMLAGINAVLLSLQYDTKQENKIVRSYMLYNGFQIFLFAISLSYLVYAVKTTEFSKLTGYLMENHNQMDLYLAIIGMIIPFLYMLGIVPFHMLCEEKTAKAILPVSHYFILIMPLAVWGVFFKLNVVLFSTFANQLQMVYLVLSVLSMVFGALGVNSRMNLHRKYALAAIFHFGVILVLLSFFTHRTDFMAFIYLVAYILSMNGIYMTFYSLKSRGEYLSLEEDLSGVAKTQELTTGALLLSLFSLMGTPFLIGFTSEFNIVYELFSLKKYSLIGIMCVLMLFVAKGYLGIIKTAYFEPKIKAYDRENAMVLFYAGVSMLSIIVLSFNPYSVWQKMEDMFYVLYL